MQLAIPHIISDDVSPTVLWHDLSSHYQSQHAHNQQQIKQSFRHYLQQEQSYLQQHLNRDIQFWEHYLSNATLFTFPKHYVVTDMAQQRHSYSTYVDLPEEAVKQINMFCAKHHLSLLDGLCAVVALTLNRHQDVVNSQVICINRVKSTRNNSNYDRQIGCFLRIEPIKVTLDSDVDLLSLAQEIHHEGLATEAYQGCPNLIKLASVGTLRQIKNRVKNAVANVVAGIYSMLLGNQNYYKIFRGVGRLNTQLGASFLINMNVHTSFLAQSRKQEHFLGFVEQKIASLPHHDLLNIDNFFDVCFMRDQETEKPILVLSANLHPGYRELIAQEMITRLMQSGQELEGYNWHTPSTMPIRTHGWNQ